MPAAAELNYRIKRKQFDEAKHGPMLFVLASIYLGWLLAWLFSIGICLTIPAAGVVLFIATWMLFRRARSSRVCYGTRVTDSLCLRCGYDLRETTGNCPECGRSVDEWLYRSFGSPETKRVRRSLKDAKP